jgi:nicotinate-nucleotide adenylyltransferase
VIGIYGGTFNPVHYGHLRTALEMKEIFKLEQMRLIPCHQSPLKQSGATSAQMRLTMLQLAIENEAGLTCDSREIDRGGKSYMVDTLASLRQEFPHEPLVLFIGSDAFAELEKWHQWQKLFDYAHLIVILRPNSPKTQLSGFLQQKLISTADQLHQQVAGKLFFQCVTQLDISATQIRALHKENRSLRFLLPDTIIDYIKQHKLYQ